MTRTHRALIVIDVQNEYVDGALPISYPPLDLSMNNIGAAIDAAASAHIPVVVVCQIAPAESPIFAEGSHGAKLHPTVAARSFDHRIAKSLPSAFAGTDLDAWLREHSIQTVTIVGYMTQNCDESTARDAAHRGFRVELLSDATGTLPLENVAGAISAQTLHEAVLITLESRFAAVLTTDEWIANLATGDFPSPTGIYASTASARS